MKSLAKIVLGLLVSWASLFTSRAQFSYSVTTNATVTINYYTGSDSVVVIPDTIAGYPVTCIGTKAFNSSPITGIIISSNVISIQTYAFANCVNLGSLTLPDGMPNVSRSAFVSCLNLTNVVLGKGVTSIDDFAFFNCTSLKHIFVPNGITNIGMAAFENCIPLDNINLPNTISNIGDFAFMYCGFTNLILSNNIPVWGGGVFAYCFNLTNITFCDGVTTIGDAAFLGCYGLTRVNIPASVTNIGSDVFWACPFLTAIEVSTNNFLYSSASGVLFNKSQTSILEFPGGKGGTYVIPDTVTNIGDSAFSDCVSLNGVVIPNTVTSIANSAFSYCSGLTNVVLPVGLVSIEGSAFYSCDSLKSITIPAAVTNLGDSAFFSCGNLTSVYFLGNAPSLELSMLLGPASQFWDDTNATVYFLPGTSGWDAVYCLLPTVQWLPQLLSDNSNIADSRTNTFGFNINWASGKTVVVEACTNIGDTWFPLQSVNLTNGSFYFSDPQWTNSPSRFYRIRSP